MRWLSFSGNCKSKGSTGYLSAIPGHYPRDLQSSKLEICTKNPVTCQKREQSHQHKYTQKFLKRTQLENVKILVFNLVCEKPARPSSPESAPIAGSLHCSRNGKRTTEDSVDEREPPTAHQRPFGRWEVGGYLLVLSLNPSIQPLPPSPPPLR